MFGDTVADMLSNKKPISIVTELLIRSRNLKPSLVILRNVTFAVPKDIRLNSTQYFI